MSDINRIVDIITSALEDFTASVDSSYDVVSTTSATLNFFAGPPIEVRHLEVIEADDKGVHRATYTVEIRTAGGTR